MQDTIIYKKQDNYLIPDLEQEELPPLGKYGRMRLAYLEEKEQQAKHLLLLMKGNLNQDLIDTEKMAHERVNQCMKELSEASGRGAGTSRNPLSLVSIFESLIKFI